MNAILEQINSAGYAFVKFAVPMLVQSSVLIAILLLVDLLLRKKVRAVFRYCIWMLVLVKLVLPSSLSSPVSFGYWLGVGLPSIKVTDKSAAVSEVNMSRIVEPASIEVSSEAPAVTAPMMDVEPAVVEAGSQPVVTSVAPVMWWGVVFLVWLAVVVVMGLLLLQRAIFVSGLVTQAKKPSSLMDDALKYCCRCIGIRGKVGLKVSANATSPAVCGLFRPVILVPENLGPSLGAGGLRAVLLHELAHIKRGDLWVNLVQTVLQIIYFYNPMLWLANAMIRRVREQAVDETVQVAMGEKARQYPETLVNVAKLAFKRPALSLRLIGVVESKSALKGRIKHMLGRPIPRSAKLGILGLIAVIIFGAILLPMAKAKDSGQRLADSEQGTKEKSEFKATLTNGVTVELVGVCEFSEGKVQNCWNPDGTKLDEQIYIKYRPYPHKTFGFVFNTKQSSEITKCEATGTSDRLGAAAVVDANGQITELARNNQQHVKLVRIDDLDLTDIKLLVAPSWQKKLRYDGKYIIGKNDPKIKFIETYETGDGIKVVLQNKYDGYELKINAMLAGAGRTRLQNSGNWTGKTYGKLSTVHSNNSELLTAAFFEKMRLSDIKHFELSIRPRPKKVTFKNVSLKPGQITDVQVEAEQSSDRIDYSSVTVTEGVGFDEIIFGCTGEFIKSKLGQPDKEVKNEKDWWLNYKKTYGLGFWVNPQENYLIEIRLNKGFKGKLTSGVTVSSTKEDVFKTYGKPIEEKTVNSMDGKYGDKILYKQRLSFGQYSQIHYDQQGLLFWFVGDKIHQIVVSRPASEETDVKVEIDNRKDIPVNRLIVPGERVSDFNLGMSKDDVLKRLGKPKMIFYGEERYTLGNLPRTYYMVFDDVSFRILDDSVKEITAHSPLYKFANGLGVGDSEQKIKQAFGNDFHLKETEWKDFLTYEDKGLEFEINKNNRTVMEINVCSKKELNKKWVEFKNVSLQPGVKTDVQVEGELESIVNKAVLTISTCAADDPKVEKSLESLKGLDEQMVVKEVARFLDSDKNTVRRSAIFVLWYGEFKNIVPAVPRLQELCSHKEEQTRGMAALALGGNKVSSIFDVLCDMTLEDSSGYARRCAAYGLGLMGNPKAKPTLEKALKDTDFNVRNNAEAALTMISQAEKKKTESNDVVIKEAVESALAWLKLIDDGDYEESWEQAAGFFKKAVGKEQFRQSVEPVRKPLGKVTSRKVKSKTYTRQVPGAPDGEYVVIQFETAFENKKAAIETVTPMLDKDGKWRVSGYYVR